MTTTGSARPPGRHKRLFFSSSECFTRCGNLAHSIECTGGHCLGRPQLHFPLLYSSAPDPNLVSLCSSDPELTPLVTIFVNKSSPCVTSRLSRRLVFTCIVISELKSWFVFDNLLSLHDFQPASPGRALYNLRPCNCESRSRYISSKANSNAKLIDFRPQVSSLYRQPSLGDKELTLLEIQVDTFSSL